MIQKGNAGGAGTAERQKILCVLMLFSTVLVGCSRVSPADNRDPEQAANPASDVRTTEVLDPLGPVDMVEVTFRVSIPDDTPSDGAIQISLLDEVTGLALNPIHHSMQAEAANIYSATLRLPAQAVIKYRYTRAAQVLAAEHTSDGRPVRYRLYHTSASGSVHDIVTRWNDTQFDGPTGRIAGTIRNTQTGSPLASIMVTAGGHTTYSRADGSYLIEGLPPGTHNLVAYPMDGSTAVFQQGAVVGANAVTPANIELTAAPVTQISFVLNAPEETIPAVPVRIAGNLFQLGNTFADLSGGISTPASRLPVLTYDPEGFYLLTMQLPVGAYIRYKYTMGDGFWNMETGPDGQAVLREMIVPREAAVLNDTVSSWSSPSGMAPVWFSVTAPSSTPAQDQVWLQLNPWSWTEPLPMWKIGPAEWVYQLSSPLNLIGEVAYRFCRNGDCRRGRQDGTGLEPTFQPSGSFTLIEEDIRQWIDLTGDAGLKPAPRAEITPRQAGFLAGFALNAGHTPVWSTQAARFFTHMKASGANTVVLSPTWTAVREDPLVIDLVPGLDATWMDMELMAEAADSAGLKISLHPRIRFPETPEGWWESAPGDSGWWQVWYEQLGIFLKHHAQLAAQMKAETILLGGPWLKPLYSGMDVPEGATSGLPENAGSLWLGLLEDVRAHYPGRLAAILSLSSDFSSPPDFTDSVDDVYVLWDVPLSADPQASLTEMVGLASSELDIRLLPFAQRYNKPIILLLSLPAVADAEPGCLPLNAGDCAQSGPLDLEAQVLMYEAILQATNDRSWVTGVISAGYHPQVGVHDRSASVHGKPAEELISAWFNAWLADR